ELGDARLERDARARRGLLEDERDGAPGEHLRSPGSRLQLAGACHDPGDLVGSELLTGEQVTRQDGEDKEPCSSSAGTSTTAARSRRRAATSIRRSPPTSPRGRGTSRSSRNARRGGPRRSRPTATPTSTMR